jgi:hypothetical protein
VRKWLRGLFGEPEEDQGMACLLRHSFRLIEDKADLMEEIGKLKSENAALRAQLEGMQKEAQS